MAATSRPLEPAPVAPRRQAPSQRGYRRRLRRRRPGRFLAAQRGAALLEFLAMFPVLLLVFAGTLYFGQHLQTQSSLSGELRSCMWQLSAASCELEALPPACQQLLADRAEVRDDPTLGRALERETSGALPPRSGSDLERGVRSTLNQQRNIALGRSVSAAPSRSVQAPRLLRLDNPTASAHYFVPCNLKPATVGDIARSLWDAL